MNGKPQQKIGMVPAGPERRKRFKVLDWGLNPNYNGRRVHVGQVLVDEMSRPTYAFRLAPLDYEHNTQPGTEAYQASSEPRVIAGYGVVEVIPDDGVWMEMILWAAEPDGWAAAHTFADVSANPVVDKNGEVIAVKSVALTRAGATDKHFLDVPLSADADRRVQQQKGVTMDWKKLLITALGLADAATDDEIKAALDKRLAQKADPAPAPLAAGPKTEAQTAPLAAQIAESVNAAVAPLAAQVKSLGEAAHRRDVDAVLERARMEGKAVPLSAEQAYALPLETLNGIVEKTPVTVPLSARTPEHVADQPFAQGPTDAQREIALNCGMDPDKVFGKKGDK